MNLGNLVGIDNFVKKGWGHEIWVRNSPDYCGKILKIDGGKKFSWHYHRLKDETFFCLEGTGVLYHSLQDCMEDGRFRPELAEKLVMYPGVAFHIRPTTRHQFVAASMTHIMEVSTEHFDEDSLRLEHGD